MEIGNVTNVYTNFLSLSHSDLRFLKQFVSLQFSIYLSSKIYFHGPKNRQCKILCMANSSEEGFARRRIPCDSWYVAGWTGQHEVALVWKIITAWSKAAETSENMELYKYVRMVHILVACQWATTTLAITSLFMGTDDSQICRLWSISLCSFGSALVDSIFLDSMLKNDYVLIFFSVT